MGVDPADARQAPPRPRRRAGAAGPAPRGPGAGTSSSPVTAIGSDRARVRRPARGRLDRGRDGGSGRPRAEAVRGIVAPGIDWPVAVRPRCGPPAAPAHARAAAVAVSKRPPADAVRPGWGALSRLAARPPVEEPRSTALRREAARPAGAGGISVVPTSCRPRGASSGPLRVSQERGLVEELVEGPEVTVNSVLSRRGFGPLTVTDRLTAEPPAFGVALAHAWPSEARSSTRCWKRPVLRRRRSASARARRTCRSA